MMSLQLRPHIQFAHMVLLKRSIIFDNKLIKFLMVFNDLCYYLKLDTTFSSVTKVYSLVLQEEWRLYRYIHLLVWQLSITTIISVEVPLLFILIRCSALAETSHSIIKIFVKRMDTLNHAIVLNLVIQNFKTFIRIQDVINLTS